MKNLISVVICLLLNNGVGGMKCLHCADSVVPTDCDTVLSCGLHEECYLDTYVTGSGKIRYSMGCRDRLQCANQQTTGKREAISNKQPKTVDIVTKEQDTTGKFTDRGTDSLKRSGDTLVCSECCTRDLCNSVGCGFKGYPMVRGPVCSNCLLQDSTDDCDKITMCGPGEACKLLKTTDPVLHHTRFQTSCEDQVRCNAELAKFREKSSLGIIGKRDTVYMGSTCLIKCCTTDLCNANCDNISHTSNLTSLSMSTATSTGPYPTTVGTTSTDSCLSNPCHRGVCSSYQNTYKCTCESGFWGRNCDSGPDVQTTSLTTLPTFEPPAIAYDCQDIQRRGLGTSDGIYKVKLWQSNRIIDVFCDLTTDGGGWTVFQKRFNGTVDFYRNFANYTYGFGNLLGEFWLGLENIHEMTIRGATELRIDLMDENGITGFEVYKNFFLSEGPGYALHKDIGNGTLDKDPRYTLQLYQGRTFSTYDHDTDLSTGNCAESAHRAWWFAKCLNSNLNGIYLKPGTRNINGMVYYGFVHGYYSLKSSSMMFRLI